LFPYLRETLDNVVTKGSFPALLLPPINFDALFASALKQAEEAKNNAEKGTKH
jgi:preprotein translocase subunit SecB